MKVGMFGAGTMAMVPMTKQRWPMTKIRRGPSRSAYWAKRGRVTVEAIR